MFCKNGVLSTSQNSSENTFVGVLSFSEVAAYRSSLPEVFLRKGVLKVCSKFIGEHPWQRVISINLQSNFIDITLRHGCSPVNLLDIFTEHIRATTYEDRDLSVTFLKRDFATGFFLWILRNNFFFINFKVQTPRKKLF